MSGHSSRFQKGRPADEPSASSGNGRVEIQRRNHGGWEMPANSMRAAGAKDGPRGWNAPDILPEGEKTIAERFADVIILYPKKKIARIAMVSPETVKDWRAGRQLPQGETLFRLARKIPTVNAFVQRESTPEFETPRTLQAVYEGLQYVAAQPGPDGDAARALLAQAHGGARG